MSTASQLQQTATKSCKLTLGCCWVVCGSVTLYGMLTITALRLPLLKLGRERVVCKVMHMVAVVDGWWVGPCGTIQEYGLKLCIQTPLS